LSQTQPIEPSRFPRIVTTISISAAAWRFLKRMALDEAEANGGRPNNSAVLERLIREKAEAERI
jgi:hypothetical protein